MKPRLGPVFEDVEIGQTTVSPAIRLTDGLGATHQSIIGNRLTLSLSESAARAACASGPLASPALVWDLAIGCSTHFTQEVLANLYYEGLAFHRYPCVGESLVTTTRVVDKKLSRAVVGRPRTGSVLLEVSTRDTQDRSVLAFRRCALLPSEAGPEAPVGWRVGDHAPLAAPSDPTASWELTGLPVWARDAPALEVGRTCASYGDVVDGAAALARLTMNIARVHHDAPASGGSRLVYGGHTIGLAFAQACRALPQVVTVLSWESCNHDGPVREGDTLSSTHEVVAVEAHPSGGRRVALTTRVEAISPGQGEAARQVLTWRWAALCSP